MIADTASRISDLGIKERPLSHRWVGHDVNIHLKHTNLFHLKLSKLPVCVQLHFAKYAAREEKCEKRRKNKNNPLNNDNKHCRTWPR